MLGQLMGSKLSEKVRRFLEEPRFAVVATINKDGTPQQTVVWYELRGDRIMMNTAAGRKKERNLKRDPRISFCIEDGYRYLTLRGRAELDYDHDRSQADIYALAVRYHGQEKANRQAREVFSKQRRVSIYMTIDDVEAYGF
jgi:PPOX class probable F420-dependent enzyme